MKKGKRIKNLRMEYDSSDPAPTRFYLLQNGHPIHLSKREARALQRFLNDVLGED